MRKRANKNSRLEFHYSYLLVALGFILTGNYINLIVFTSLVLIHELGHTLTAILFHIKVKKIIIYPFGGITKLDSMINLNIEKELLIALSGVLLQFIFYLCICLLGKYLIIREYTIKLYSLYNSRIIFFNLLPIYPLDGGRIFNLLISIKIPYRLSNLVTIVSSLIGIITLILCNIYIANYSNIMTYLLLFTYLIKFYKKRKFIYQRFLLERYLYNLEFNKIKIIKNYKNMYKDKKHLIFNKNKYLKEEEILKRIFN